MPCSQIMHSLFLNKHYSVLKHFIMCIVNIMFKMSTPPPRITAQHPLRPLHAPPRAASASPAAHSFLARNLKLGHERAGVMLSARLVVGRRPNYLAASTTKAARTQPRGHFPPRRGTRCGSSASGCTPRWICSQRGGSRGGGRDGADQARAEAAPGR